MTAEERDIEIADYLTGDLSPEDRARFERELETDDALRQEVEALRELSGELALTAKLTDEEVETPPLTLPVEEIPSGRRGPGRSRRPSRPRLALLSLAGAAVIAILVVVLVSGGPSESPEPQSTIALDPIDDGPPEASGELRYQPGKGSAVLTVSGLAPTGSSDYYEAWLISDGQRQLLPLGTFSVAPDGKADVRVELPADSEEFRFLDISLEPDDGDPAHSGDSVLRGPVAPS